MEDASGNWHGTTLHGGAHGNGTVYEIAHDGTFSTLYSFTGKSDGADPQGGVILAPDGNLYGTTTYNGSSNNAGTVFRITPQGALTTLHQFDYTDGSISEVALTPGPDGALYGIATNGGANRVGTMFRVGLDGSFSLVYSFAGSSFSQQPTSSLTLMADGNFYGVRAQDGGPQFGTIYRLSPTGSYTQLYAFGGTGSNGQFPEAAMALGTDGALYGTTLDGGTYGSGTVFRFVPSLVN